MVFIKKFQQLNRKSFNKFKLISMDFKEEHWNGFSRFNYTCVWINIRSCDWNSYYVSLLIWSWGGNGGGSRRPWISQRICFHFRILNYFHMNYFFPHESFYRELFTNFVRKYIFNFGIRELNLPPTIHTHIKRYLLLR